MTVAFECWEIAFPNDPDGEATRGIDREHAAQLVQQGVLRVLFAGVVRNAAGERVLSHTYVPVDGREADAWAAWLGE